MKNVNVLTSLDKVNVRFAAMKIKKAALQCFAIDENDFERFEKSTNEHENCSYEQYLESFGSVNEQCEHAQLVANRLVKEYKVPLKFSFTLV